MYEKKRVLKFVLVLCSIIILTSCGNKIDEASQKVIDEINALGQISLDDEEKVNSVYEEYRSLSEKQKNHVTNVSTLISAKEEIARLKGKQLEEEKRIEEEKAKEVKHNRTVAEWAKSLTASTEVLSAQVTLEENDEGEITGNVKFKFNVSGFKNLTLDDPDVKEACLDSMDDYMFAIKNELQADNYTIKEIVGKSEQYNKTIIIP